MLAGLVAAFAASTWMLLDTQEGLRWALEQASTLSRGAITVANAKGRLLGPLTLHGIEYRRSGTAIEINKLELNWTPRALLTGTLRVDRLVVSGGFVTLPPRGRTNAAPSIAVPPLAVRIVDARLTDLSITGLGISPLHVRTLTLKATLRRHQLRIHELVLHLPKVTLSLRGSAGLAPKLHTALDLDWTAQLIGMAPFAASGTLRGDWEKMLLDQRLNAPVPGHLTLQLNAPFTQPRWQLALSLPRFELRQLKPAWGATSLAAQVRGHGTEHDAILDAHLRTDASAHAVYPVELSARLARLANDASESVRLQLRLPQRGSELSLSGQLASTAQNFDLHADWKKLAWPLTGTIAYVSEQGSTYVRGTLDAYRLTLNAQLAGPRIPSAQLQADARGNRRHLDVDALHAKVLGGALEASGSLAWRPQPSWSLTLRAQGIDPGTYWPQWGGRLNGQMTSRGEITANKLRANAEIANLAGTLRGYPMRADGRGRLDGGKLEIERLQVVSGGDTLKAHGRVTKDWDLTWQFDAPHLSMLFPGWRGELESRGTLTGPRARPRLRLRLQGTRVAGNALRASTLSANIDASLDPEQTSRVSVRAEKLEVYGEHFRTALLQGVAQSARQELSVTGRGTRRAIDFQLEGRWQGHSWHGRLMRAGIDLPALGHWTLVQPAALYANIAQRRISRLCWQSGAARLCANAAQTAGRSWTVSAKLKRLPLGALGPLLPPPLRLQGSLDGQLRARRTAGQPVQAQLEVSIPPGRAAYRTNGQVLHLHYGGGDVHAVLDTAGLNASAALRLVGDDRIALEVHLPAYGRRNFYPGRQPVNGLVQVHLKNLAWLAALGPDLGSPSGAFNAALDLSGTLAEPLLRGQLTLADGRFDIAPLGINVRHVALVAHFAPDGAMQLLGSAQSGNGELKVKGSGRLEDAKRWRAHLDLAGTDFQAVNTPDAQILVSPSLRLEVRPYRLDVDGEVKVPEAKFHPRKLAAGVETVSPDVEIIGGRGATHPQPWKLGVHVHLVLGNKVQFDGFGLAGKLRGDLYLAEESGKVTTGRGQVEIRGGTYRAFGQDLKVTEGRLLFAGGTIENPGLDVRATRQVGSVSTPITVGLQVNGTAKNPMLSLFSTPPMSQADTLSYLLTGHALSNASAAEGQLLYGAASSLGFAGGNRLAEHIASTFGLQEARIETSSSLHESALVLGKYLSPRLYIKYSFGLVGAVNQLRIRYELSKHWALETETGLQSGADLLYTLER